MHTHYVYTDKAKKRKKQQDKKRRVGKIEEAGVFQRAFTTQLLKFTYNHKA